MIRPTPLFPLNMTLFPGGRLPLQIFETRYIDMIREQMKRSEGFVIVSIKEGHEVGQVPEIYHVGTYAEITDWNTLPNGLLGITVEGRHKVSLSNISVSQNDLVLAEIEAIDAEPDVSLPEKFIHFNEILKSVKTNPLVQALNLEIDYRSATDVSSRLAELLPFDIEDKQALLELQDPLERLERIQAILDVLGSEFNIPV